MSALRLACLSAAEAAPLHTDDTRGILDVTFHAAAAATAFAAGTFIDMLCFPMLAGSRA